MNALSAQQPDSIRTLFDHAHRDNWYLRAHLADSTKVEGRVPRLQEDAAAMGGGSVRFDQVAALERRLYVGTSAKSLGITIGVQSGGLWAALGWSLCDCAKGTVRWGAGGFVGGFALGAFVGSFMEGGRTEWRELSRR